MKHTVVWIDHKEARLFEVDAEAIEQSIIKSRGPHIDRHAKDQEVRVRNHPDDEPRFFHEVAQALEGPAQVLVVGPPNRRAATAGAAAAAAALSCRRCFPTSSSTRRRRRRWRVRHRQGRTGRRVVPPLCA